MINETPLRTPDAANRTLMSRRGWWLIVASFCVPGLAQLLAGNRRMARRGLRVTFSVWVIALAAVIVTILNPTFLAGIVAGFPWLFYVLAAVLVGLAIFWLVYFLNAVKLAHLSSARPVSRSILIAFILLAVVACVGVTAKGTSMALSAGSGIASVFRQTKMADPVDGRYNVLLLGGDSGKGRWSLRTDSMTLVSVDAATGKSVTIGIPRNLLNVPFPDGTVMHKLYPNGYNCGSTCMMNSLYVQGMAHKSSFPSPSKNGGRVAGIQATIDGAEGVTGLKVQYYVLVNMKGFKELINALGGVTITVPERLPKTTGHGTKGYIEAGKQKMDGSTALWYARIRHNPGGSDYQRMARQRQLQRAILQQISPQTIVTKFEALTNATEATVETDIPSGQLQGFIDLANKARKHKPVDLELVRPKVNSEDPNYPKIHRWVQEATAKASGSASPSK